MFKGSIVLNPQTSKPNSCCRRHNLKDRSSQIPELYEMRFFNKTTERNKMTLSLSRQVADRLSMIHIETEVRVSKQIPPTTLEGSSTKSDAVLSLSLSLLSLSVIYLSLFFSSLLLSVVVLLSMFPPFT